MSQIPLRDPHSIDVDLGKGVTKQYLISHFPAIAGREIIAKYPLSSIPKLGDYDVNQETMLKLMSYVAIPIAGGEPLRLSTAELVDNHVPSWEALTKIEMAMLEYNCTFFERGFLQSFIEILMEKAAPLLSKILTSSLQALSQMDKQLTSS